MESPIRNPDFTGFNFDCMTLLGLHTTEARDLRLISHDLMVGRRVLRYVVLA